MTEKSLQDTDESAAVVLVQAEVLQAIYVMVHLVSNVLANSDIPLNEDTRKSLSKIITNILNDYYNDGLVTWQDYGIEPALMRELFEEIRQGVELSPVMMEDAIGFTVLDGTTIIAVHFDQEGLKHARITS